MLIGNEGRTSSVKLLGHAPGAVMKRACVMAEFGLVMSQMMPLGCGGRNKGRQIL